MEHGGTFGTRKEALVRRDLIAGMLAGGLDPKVELRRQPESAQRFSEVAEAWITSRRRVSDGTRAGYRYRMPVLVDTFGPTPIDEITVSDVIAWVGGLERDYAAGTVGLFVRQLRQILDFVEGPNVARDRRVEIPRMVQKEIDPPDAQEVVAVVGKLAERFVVPVLAMEQLGSRVSETLSLTRDDVQEDRVRFRREATKGQRQGRVVECEPLLAEALAGRVPLAMSRDAVGRELLRVGRVHPHLLRHRRGSLWHQQGVVAAELARRLGHAHASMSLDRYAHVKPLREIAPHVLASFLR